MRQKCTQCGRACEASKGLNVALCATCEAAIAEEVRTRVRRIHEALEVWGNGADLSEKQKECDRIIEEAEALSRYEARGILTTAPPPSALLAHFRAKRAALGEEGVDVTLDAVDPAA